MTTHYAAGRRFARRTAPIIARQAKAQAAYRAALVDSFGEADVARMERTNTWGIHN